MLNQYLPVQKTPKWLASILPDNFEQQPLALNKILPKSFFYPSCGFDWETISHFIGRIRSFICFDYGHYESEIRERFLGRPPKGYRLLCIRTLSLKELAPEGYLLVIPEDSRYNKVVSGMFRKPAYSLWAIYESMTDSTNRFSVVFLCTEGATGYQALYYPTLTRPEVVAVVAPGDGFGGNCFSFQDEKDILGKSVLEFHPAGRPRWLVTHLNRIWNTETEFRKEFIDGLELSKIRKPPYSCKNGIVPKLISETHLPDWAVAVHRKVHERSKNWNHLEIRVWQGGHTRWQKYLGHSENDFSWKTDEAEFYLRMPPVYSSTSKWIFNKPESHYKDFKQMEHDELMAKVSACYWEMGSTFRSRNKPEVGR